MSDTNLLTFQLIDSKSAELVEKNRTSFLSYLLRMIFTGGLYIFILPFAAIGNGQRRKKVLREAAKLKSIILKAGGVENVKGFFNKRLVRKFGIQND
jgi:hypothetical protein